MSSKKLVRYVGNIFLIAFGIALFLYFFPLDAVTPDKVYRHQEESLLDFLYRSTVAYVEKAGTPPVNLSDLEGIEVGGREFSLRLFEKDEIIVYVFLPELLQLRKRVASNAIPIAYAMATLPGGKHFTLFADGHISQISEPELKETIEELKKMLESQSEKEEDS